MFSKSFVERPKRLMSSKKTDCGIHFFLDDYQFMRLWNNPERYVDLLKNLIVYYRLISAFTLIIRQRCRFIIIIANIGLRHVGRCIALR